MGPPEDQRGIPALREQCSGSNAYPCQQEHQNRYYDLTTLTFPKSSSMTADPSPTQAHLARHTHSLPGDENQVLNCSRHSLIPHGTHVNW